MDMWGFHPGSQTFGAPAKHDVNIIMESEQSVDWCGLGRFWTVPCNLLGVCRATSRRLPKTAMRPSASRAVVLAIATSIACQEVHALVAWQRALAAGAGAYCAASDHCHESCRRAQGSDTGR